MFSDPIQRKPRFSFPFSSVRVQQVHRAIQRRKEEQLIRTEVG